LLRIAQEAIHNVKKHAEAKQMFVQLEYGPADDRARSARRRTRFCSSDGKPESLPGHYGLTGMRERAAAIGGHSM
jgi:signal transduction histidine kinase